MRPLGGLDSVGHVSRLFRARGSRILSVCFYTNAPALRNATRIVHALRQGKMRVVRVNVPFDSPVTSNPIVRRTTARTLRGNVALHGLFNRLRRVHASIHVPLMLVNCLGPVVRCNFRGFYQRYRTYNVSNIVVPSLPCGSCLRDCHPVTRRCNVRIVVLVAPRADRRHVQRVSTRASKFVCVMSSTTIAKTRGRFGTRGRTCFRHVGRVRLQGPQVVKFKVSGGSACRSTTTCTSKYVVKDGFIALLRRRGGTRGTVSGLLRVLGGRKWLVVLLFLTTCSFDRDVFLLSLYRAGQDIG